MDCLSDVGELEAIVGAQPLPSMLKSISEFDEHCRAILAVARVAVMGAVGPDGYPRTHLIGDDSGFASVAGPSVLDVNRAGGPIAGAGAPVGALFLVPGVGETLRVNGRLRSDGGIDAEEIYLHCAKAILRSELWSGGPAGIPEATTGVDGDGPLAPTEVREILARSPFAVITSHDGQGHADASPKGDPAGFVRILNASTIALPDRPGNRRTDTWHNVVARREVGLLALVPGDDRVLEVRGRAGLTADDAVREPMAVRGRVPKVALIVEVDHAEVRHSPAIAASALWDEARNVDPRRLPKAPQVWTDHVRANRTKGMAATAIRKMANARVLEVGIRSDYAKNLY